MLNKPRKYVAAFLLPSDTVKKMDKDGWTFCSKNKINLNAIKFLKHVLKLELSETYLGIEQYRSNKYQASVEYDDDGGILNIAFQIYSDDADLEKIYLASKYGNSGHLFFP